jgi:hypothetical protein
MYGGRTVAIEQWGIVGGIDRNEGYDLQLEGGSAEVATEPGRAMSMVTPTFYLKRNPDGSIKEPAEKDTSKPHPYKGAIFLLDGNTATHVASPHMVNVNNFLGVAGPSDLDGDWFDEYAVLPTVSFKPTL